MINLSLLSKFHLLLYSVCFVPVCAFVVTFSIPYINKRDGVNLSYFKLRELDLTEFLV